MNELIIELKNPSATKNLGRNLARGLAKSTGIILLRGQLGAGKTTLTQGFVEEVAQSVAYVSSPTYAYMNTYPSDPAVYHFDLYRISDIKEIHALGLMEFLLDQSALRIIEWPENSGVDFSSLDLLADIELVHTSDERRARVLCKNIALYKKITADLQN